MSDYSYLDLAYYIEVTSREAEEGSIRRLQIDDEVVEVKIPPQTRDGQQLRVDGKGNKGIGRSGIEARGDLLLEVRVLEDTEETKRGVESGDTQVGSQPRSRFRYKVVDIDVPIGHNTQAALAEKAQKVIERHASDGWRLHTYQITGFGRSPGFLGVTFENICHLVFEKEVA